MDAVHRRLGPRGVSEHDISTVRAEALPDIMARFVRGQKDIGRRNIVNRCQMAFGNTGPDRLKRLAADTREDWCLRRAGANAIRIDIAGSDLTRQRAGKTQ